MIVTRNKRNILLPILYERGDYLYKPTLTVLCGLSGSGKSQYIRRHNKVVNAIVISTDDIREELCGAVEDQSRNGEVFQEFHKRIRQNLKEGHDVFAEATNITMKSRRAILNTVKEIDCEKICVVIVKPFAQCKRDNLYRVHPVPEHVIEKQVLKFQIPFKEEGAG